MPDLWMDVDAALSEVPVNVMPLIDDTDFKTREESLTYNQAGMDLVWNFTTTAGAFTQTAVTPTSGGDYDWTNQGNGMYTIEIPASSGASINNDTEGFGWFSGFCTGVLPWRGPTIGFRAAGLNNALIDSAYSTTRGLAGTALPDAAADAAGGLPISDGGGLDMDAILADTNELQGDWANGGRLDLIVDSILADTDELQTDDIPTAISNLNNLSAAQVNAEVDTALADYDGPTHTELTTALSGLNDPTAAAIADAVWDEATTGHVTSGTFGEQLKTDVDAILADTNELQTDDIPTAISNLNDPTAAEIRAEIDSNSTQLAAIVADTNELQSDDIPGTLATIAAYIDTEVAAIKAVTDNLPDSGALTSLAQGSDLATTDSVVDNISSAVVGNLSELTGISSAPSTPTVKQALMLLYMWIRNGTQVTATERRIFNDAGTEVLDATMSDNGTTFDQGKLTDA